MSGMSRIKVSLAAALLLWVASGCGGSGGTVSSGDIDRNAWSADLVKLDGVRDDPDLDALERLTRDTCSQDVDQIALGLTLEGARPDITRVNMKYVCPDELDKLDEAEEQVADL